MRLDKESMKSFLTERLKNNHFIAHMGLILEDVDDGYAEMSLDIETHHLQQNGFMHGGVTATLCDVVTGIAAYTTVNEEKNVVTADLKVSYLNPSTCSKVLGVGRVVKAGKFLIFCEAQVFDLLEDGSKVLVATCTSIMASVDIPVMNR
ncbi:MAG: PaaI family thioesterase [Bacteroidia bacterium]|nr:PaaI family thioesterase [Bacteroidia bacterium]